MLARAPLPGHPLSPTPTSALSLSVRLVRALRCASYGGQLWRAAMASCRESDTSQPGQNPDKPDRRDARIRWRRVSQKRAGGSKPVAFRPGGCAGWERKPSCAALLSLVLGAVIDAGDAAAALPVGAGPQQARASGRCGASSAENAAQPFGGNSSAMQTSYCSSACSGADRLHVLGPRDFRELGCAAGTSCCRTGAASRLDYLFALGQGAQRRVAIAAGAAAGIPAKRWPALFERFLLAVGGGCWPTCPVKPTVQLLASLNYKSGKAPYLMAPYLKA